MLAVAACRTYEGRVTTSPKHPSRLPEIEVLRGLAVAGVVEQHAYGNLATGTHRTGTWLLHHVHYWTGVDLFFAISGFVIARSLLPMLARTQGARGFVTTAGAFWIRRAWRLLPSAWLWLTLCLLLSAVFNRSGVFQSVHANAWAMLAGVLDFANLRFADAIYRYDYGASFAWWSLSLEEQFYVVLPPLAFLCGRFLPLLLLPVVLLTFGMPRTLVLMAFRTDAIILGVLLACWEPHATFARAGAWLKRLPAVLRAGLAVGLVLWLGVLGTHNPFFDRYTVGLVALVSAALVFMAAQDTGLILPEGAARRFMVWLGTRSYALYLIHIPAFLAARELWFRIGGAHGDAPVVATGFVLLFACAELNWRYVEQPLRRRGARIAAQFASARSGPALSPPQTRPA